MPFCSFCIKESSAAVAGNRQVFPVGVLAPKVTDERGMVWPLIHCKRSPFPRRGAKKQNIPAFTRRGGAKK